MLIIVQTVADDESVGHLKAGVVGIDVRFAPGGLVHQGRNGDGGGASWLRSLLIFTAPVELVPL